jgi:hypothetical protein
MHLPDESWAQNSWLKAGSKIRSRSFRAMSFQQGHVILSHITLKIHYFSKIMKFSRNDARTQRNL